MNRKLATIAGLMGSLLVLDIITKQWALRTLGDGYTSHLLGGLVPVTLTYNRGVAFGLSVGGSRWIIIVGTALVMCALVVLLRQARPSDQLRVASIAAVMSGAMGNLFDRLRWERGVVDFIGPFNLGFAHFPIFNVADMAITVGAAALAISLWLEERNVEPAPAQPESPPAEPSTDLV
jgi:signal peptidase II